jgi:putative ABC transport system permease protein
MNNFWRDVRFGLRLLTKNKSFTAVAVLALALGIGPNTAIFSVIYATLLAPMPYPNPDQLVVVWSRINGTGRNVVSAGDFLDWQRENTAFQGIGAASGSQYNLATAREPEQVQAQLMTPGCLGLFGYTPLLGRADFLKEEGQAGRDQVLILSNRLWKRRFGADPGIIGRQIRMNEKPYTVVGVLGPGQADRLQQEMWVPLVFKPEQINHDFHWLIVLARLKNGVTLKQAQTDMNVVTRHIAQVYPQSNKNWTSSVEPLQNDFLSRDTRTHMWLLMGAVGFVLLIACVNVANLLLARGTSRQKEVAVRASLGANRSQLVRQLLTESLALAVIGGALGVAMGWAILKALMNLMPKYTLPSEAEVGLNLPVLAFTLCATLLAGVLFGCAPAWQATRLDLVEPLKESGRSMGGGGRHRLRRALVVVEFALALSLLTGAGLAIHSFWNQTQADMGFRGDHVLTFNLPVPGERFKEAAQINGFYRQLLERIEALPGVQRAMAGTGMPLDGTYFGMPFSIAGKPVSDPSARPGAAFQMVTAGYYQTFGVNVVRGRAINEQDVAGSLRVAMVNENFVHRFLQGVDPLRERVLVEELIPGVTRLGPVLEWQIVGVFRDVRTPEILKDSDYPEIDVPFYQSPWPGAVMAVRTSGDPAGMQKSIAATIHTVDPSMPLAQVRTMEQVMDEHLSGDRFSTVLYGSFAGVALLLAAVGIYGVMAFAVAQRTHEIGLRMALGADRGRVLGLVLREGMTLALAGLAVGLAGAWFVGRAMKSILYGTGTIDYTALSVAAAVLLVSALLACWFPAWRATAVDPIIALREE